MSEGSGGMGRECVKRAGVEWGRWRGRRWMECEEVRGGVGWSGEG